jgi:hypothetical protein
MTRRLLPYEYQLITELGISKDEYLDFLQVQFDYTRLPADKLATPQNDPGTIAIVLTIVGTLFQVAAALLAPTPETDKRAQRSRREQVFAPRFGFNSAQELAKYGDPVNLVYCNTDPDSGNPTGGVRVATSLVWSAVQSFGSSQFMQMMAVVGAANIDPAGIDFERTAFGQMAIRQFSAQRAWMYFSRNGNLRFSDLRLGQGTDPTRTGAPNSDFAYKASLTGSQRAEGFSQAFSPSTMTRCGVYAPIPINVNYYDRNDKGKGESADLGIELRDRGSHWPDNKLDNSRALIPLGKQFRLHFSGLASSGASDVRQAASELRRTLLSNIDVASTYKLGSAHLRVIGPVEDLELDNDSTTITLECVKEGLCPEEDYATTNFKQNAAEAEAEIVNSKARIAELTNLLTTSLPELKPGVGGSANDKLNQINGLIDSIEELRDQRWTAGELDSIVNDDGDIYDDRINPFAQRVLDTRRNRDNERNQIEEWQEEISAERKKNNTSQSYIDRRRQWIREARGRIEQLSKRIRNQQAKLDWAVREYGFNTPKGGNLRNDRKYFLRQQAKLQEEIAALYSNSENIDQDRTNRRNDAWRNEIASKEREIAYYESVLKNPELQNDFFNTKCLVKIEEAAYETITPCRVVDFALKARVFKRVQGRQKEYGEVKMDNYKESDNGVKLRSMFFWVWQRRPGGQWQRVPRIFVIRRGADIDNYISLKFIADDNLGNWQFRFEPIADTAAEMRTYGSVDFAYIENSGPVRTIAAPAGGSFTFRGKLRSRDGYVAPINNNPSELDEWGLFSMRSDTQLAFSFDNGPELEIKAVTEQSTEPFANYPGLYTDLSLFGFNIYSGQGVQDLRSMTVFVKRGKLVRQLNDDGTYSSTPTVATSLAPEVFLDTILDPANGIGRYAKVAGIDLKALALAKRFCTRNRLFFDGVIADPTSWRQFWSEVAPYSLLELGRIGGKETLVPAVPCDNAGNITRAVPITALFNQGNILEDSYKEEFIDYGSSVQDLIATVIYRDTEIDGVFPRNSSVEISRVGVTEADAVRQTFDLSQFVTRRDQAIKYGKLLCNQRRYVRRAIEFSTFPTNSVLSPGAYIYVAIGQNQWDNVMTGVVESGGVLNVPLSGGTINGSGYTALLYTPGAGVSTVSGVSVNNGIATALATYAGQLFVLGSTVTRKRVFRITEVQMDEEGEVSVKAIEHPCEESGTSTLSLIADFNDAQFTVR